MPTATQTDPGLSRPSRPDHYFAVDVLRGFAAIAVLFYHYQHFYYAPGVFEVEVRELAGQMPMYGLFFPLYLYGGSAVQVFWLISGFVFASVYASRHTPGSEFFIKRFARLYPLHFLTLIVVAALQVIALSSLGTYLIYEHNDGYHFVLNIFMASSWGLEEGYSFNSPIWSVSVEVISYAFFWLVAKRLLRAGIAGPLILALAAGALFHLEVGNWMIWQCAMYFFVGCAVYQIAGNHRHPIRDLAIMIAACIALLAVIAIFSDLTIRSGLLLFSVVLVGSAALVDTHRLGTVFRHVRFIGDSTYGSYLWHVPVQLTALLVINQLGIDPQIRNSPVFLTAFIAICCVGGWLSYLFFEKPANRSILRWWKTRTLQDPAARSA